VLCAKNGFISAYAETSQEDDFNCVVQHLFDGEWPSNIDEYPQLKKKFEIAMEFYHKLDAQFDTHFFESLRTK
jgi:hypothetical protein